MVIKLSFSAKVGRKRRQKPQQCGSPTKTPRQSSRIKNQVIVEKGEYNMDESVTARV